jgi:hypothetical protein
VGEAQVFSAGFLEGKGLVTSSGVRVLTEAQLMTLSPTARVSITLDDLPAPGATVRASPLLHRYENW